MGISAVFPGHATLTFLDPFFFRGWCSVSVEHFRTGALTLFAIFPLPIIHLVYSPHILHNYCFQFLLGIVVVPRELEVDACATFWGGSKRDVLWALIINNEVLILLPLPTQATPSRDDAHASLRLQNNVARSPRTDDEAIGSGIHVTRSFCTKLVFSTMEGIKFEKNCGYNF